MRSSFLKSLWHAISGFGVVCREEMNMRIHLAVVVLVILFGVRAGLDRIEWAFVIIACALVLSLELINSGAERLIDAMHPRVSPTIRSLKDILASGVLVVSLAAAALGVIILGPHSADVFSFLNF